MPTQVVKLRRTVNYFNITFSFKSDSEKQEQFLTLFRMIVDMSHDKDADRYKQINGSLLFVQDVKFDTAKQVRGKILSIGGATPEILNTKEDVIRDVAIESYEGVAKTTHFVLSYEKSKRRIAVEYNDDGPKADEFEDYLRHIGQRVGLIAIEMTPVFNQDIVSELLRRMGRCKEIIIQAHRGNIASIKKIDHELGNVFESADTLMRSETVTVRFQYDFKKLGDSQKALELIKRLSIALKRNPTSIDAFKKLQVKAEDTENKGLLQVFDLIEDKTKSILKFERKLTADAFIDADVYDKISAEMQRLNLI